MYSKSAKNYSYAIIFAGIILILLGMWYLIPKSYDSDTPSYVFMTLAAIRITFPILGVLMVLIGNILLIIIRQTREEIEFLKKEISSFRKL